MVSNELVEAFGETEELEIFEKKSLKDVLNFKWKAYAGRIHMIMFGFHCIYLVFFSMFVNEFYVYRSGYLQHLVLMGSAICLVFPMAYDMT